MPTSPSVRRTALPVALAAVAVLSLSACGSSDSKEEATTAGNAGAASAALGAEDKATGAPLVLGFVSTGRTQAIDTSDEIAGAEAAAAYVNAHLGGINGRELQLKVCEEKGTPAGAQDCGRQLVDAKVPAVVSGSSGTIGVVAGIVEPAGIPTFTNIAAAKEVLGGKHAFVFGNPLAPFGGAAAYARSEGFKKAAAFVIDVPAASGPAKQLIPAFFGNAGAQADVVAIPPGTADMTPQVQAAAGGKPDQIHLLGDPTFCASALKAIRTLGVKAKVTMLDRCVAPNGAQGVPGGYEGVVASVQADLDPADAEVKLFDAVLDTYGKDTAPSALSASGYQAVLSLARALDAAEVSDYTSTGIEAAVRAAPATPYPLAGGATFQCNGTALAAVSKNICSTFTAVADVTEKGTLQNYRTIDTEGIFVLGR